MTTDTLIRNWLDKVPAGDQLRAALYGRQSMLKDDKSESAERQIQRGEELAAGRGHRVVGVFTDEGISAYDGSHRPGFDRLLDAVARGQVDVVIAAHTDRLWRQPVDRMAFMVLAKASGLTSIETVHGGTETMGNVDGEFLGDLQAILSKRESATIGRRMRDKHDAKRAAGEWPGGAAPVGYTNDPANKSIAVEPIAAAAMRETFRRVLAGASLADVVDYLRATGAIPKMRPSWGRQYLTNPVYASLRKDGTPGNWPSLISREDHESIVAIFDARSRGKRGPGRRRPLSGFVYCSTCHTPMQSHSDAKHAGAPASRSWICSKPLGGCGMLIRDHFVQSLVAEWIGETIDSDHYRKASTRALDASPTLAATARALTAARDRLASFDDPVGDGTWSPVQYRKQATRVRAEIALLEAELREASASTDGASVALPGNGAALVAEWRDEWSDEERRLIVGRFVERIQIRPRVTPGPKFQPARVVIAGKVAA